MVKSERSNKQRNNDAADAMPSVRCSRASDRRRSSIWRAGEELKLKSDGLLGGVLKSVVFVAVGEVESTRHSASSFFFPLRTILETHRPVKAVIDRPRIYSASAPRSSVRGINTTVLPSLSISAARHFLAQTLCTACGSH